MEQFILILEDIVKVIAHSAIFLLELIGMLVIIFGAFKALYYSFIDIVKHKHHNIKISLAKSLALGLEFKMGAEIIKTVIVRDLTELLVLGVIIVLRAILAFLIHWEINTGKKEDEVNQATIKETKEDK